MIRFINLFSGCSNALSTVQTHPFDASSFMESDMGFESQTFSTKVQFVVTKDQLQIMKKDRSEYVPEVAECTGNRIAVGPHKVDVSLKYTDAGFGPVCTFVSRETIAPDSLFLSVKFRGDPVRENGSMGNSSSEDHKSWDPIDFSKQSFHFAAWQRSSGFLYSHLDRFRPEYPENTSCFDSIFDKYVAVKFTLELKLTQQKTVTISSCHCLPNSSQMFRALNENKEDPIISFKFVGGQENLLAHKSILFQNDVFSKMFSSGFKEAGTYEISTEHTKHYSRVAYEWFLKYLYGYPEWSRDVSEKLRVKKLIDIFNLSQFFDIGDLGNRVQKCIIPGIGKEYVDEFLRTVDDAGWQFLIEPLQNKVSEFINGEHVWDWMHIASNNGYNVLHQKCEKYAKSMLAKQATKENALKTMRAAEHYRWKLDSTFQTSIGKCLTCENVMPILIISSSLKAITLQKKAGIFISTQECALPSFNTQPVS